MFRLFIFCMFYYFVSPFNISNMNEFTKNNVISKLSDASKFSNVYLLNSYSPYDENENDEEDTIQTTKEHRRKNKHMSHHNTLDNTLFFYSNVDQETSLALEQKLLALNAHNLHLVEKYQLEKTPIHLHIQSFGGSLFHSLYLVDLIQNLETPVYTYVDGFAASAATLLSISGKKRFISKNSLMLIHQLSSNSAGKYSELKDESENLDVLMDFIMNHYLTNTKINKSELLSLLKRDIWLNSSSCLKYGLVDEII